MADPGSPDLTVFYDADCGFCERCTEVLRRLDRGRRVRWLPLQAAVENVPDAPSRTELLASMHALTARGEWVRGSEAWVRIATLVPVMWPLALVARLPLVRPLVDRAYHLVADNRQGISQRLGMACRVDSSRS